MVKINGLTFYDEPASCGSCPAFNNGATHLNSGSELGHCIFLNEWHKRWCSTPRRCARLFKKAMTFPDGEELIITTP